jgi:shikimate dehydrogenase
MRVTSATRVFALLGDPVAHSLSPHFQNAALRAQQRDAVYVALRCDAAQLPVLMRVLAAAGGGGNVTVPHKRAAAAALDVATDLVTRTGACNTFHGVDGALHGDNTDVAGCAAAVHALVGSVRGARVLVLGAGGGAAAAACALLDAGAGFVEVRGRTHERAHELCARVSGDAGRCAAGDPDVRGAAGFDLVVNATPLGVRDGDAMPLPLVRGMAPVFDMAYAPGGTAWVRAAAQLGIRAADGREMLLQQGARAYESWFATTAPLDVMRAALDAALEAALEAALAAGRTPP